MGEDTQRLKRLGWLQRLAQALSGELHDREDLLEHLRDARARGLIDRDALEMLQGVIEVADIQVRDIMVPRAQMVCVRRDDPLAKLLPIIVESGHSRFPVMDTDRDDVVGILLAKDVLRVFAGPSGGEFDIRECMRPAVFVPESKRVNVLLQEFRRNRNHMAIVVDEYGGVAGLVTIEDAVEQIVGDIADEFDTDDDGNIRREDARNFTVRGATPIDEFNQYFGTELSDAEFDTVAGLVIKQLGRLPRRGETVALHGFEFRVARTDRRRIDSLRVTAPHDVPAPPETEATG
ncbi:MAG: CBS domain-containing protein [Steroidobacteraceae bacterium]|nr:CBS domain-containing protein [Steroidobacteraceae bacterium]MDW8257823.1 transporter associated domain-containing protein [Gammaproteobacteria bacterium]